MLLYDVGNAFLQFQRKWFENERSRIILPTEFDTAPFCNPGDRGLLYVYHFKVVWHEDASLEMLRRFLGIFGLARGQRLVFGMV